MEYALLSFCSGLPHMIIVSQDKEDVILFRSKIIRDTIMLTVMQLFLDTAALLLNVFITKKLGASAIGILTLTGSFLSLAGIISNGNAFLCMSRLVSEEMGRKGGNPNRILIHGIRLCLMLSITVSAAVFLLADTVSSRFFSGADMASAVRFMPFALVSGAVSSCFKGYFNAGRKSSVTAAGDILEFIVKSAVIVVFTLAADSPSEGVVCKIMIAGIIAGNISSLIFFLIAFAGNHGSYTGRGTRSFREYALFAFPIMGGGVLTALLSSTNDALIPMCLRQSGNSVSEAFSNFGIFEAIVIPVLFFPSVVLCSMSGIIVSETARAAAAGNRERIKSFSSRLVQWTLMFSVFASAVLMRFGRQIGELLGGGDTAGKMITIIAPVVPFIYMEIILEAMIKGMGMQAFSSLNYLAEYVIRISIVLVFVPRIGFYGIAASYYASNVIGNCSRFIKLLRTTGMSFEPFRLIVVPFVYAYMTMCPPQILMNFAGISPQNIPEMVIYTLLWGAGYFAVFTILGRIRIFDKRNSLKIVKNAQ